MIDILSMDLQELEEEILKTGEQKFRARQIFLWLHQKKIDDFSKMTNLSKQIINTLSENFYINSLFIEKTLVSDTDNTVKYLYTLSDSEKIETVLMSYKHGNSLCISTQVGCRMGCAFCASGIGGFVRNLTPSEMLLQIYETERQSGKTVDSIVLMGIGEPLDNFYNVIKFMDIISNKVGRNMSLRHLSLSTSGLCDEIDRLAELNYPLTLSISLHGVDDDSRSAIMPINKKYNIKRLMESCYNYFLKTGRRLSFEFALIEGVNDDKLTAEKLIKLIRPLKAHINLIPINPVKERSFKKSKSVLDFQNTLLNGGVNTTIRRTLGNDIGAACGQLRRG